MKSRPASPIRRLHVSENRRFLVRDDGRPFSWFGDTAWELFHRLTREEADWYLRRRREQGFTVIQAVALAEFEGIRRPNAYGDYALVDEDPARPGEGYFSHVDFVVAHANALGLTIGFLPTWGDKVGRTHGDGPAIFSVGTARRYGQFLGERYRGADLVWILGGDRLVDDDEKRAIWRALGEGVRDGDGGAHLVTFHPRGGDDAASTSSAAFPNDDPLLDFNMRQNGHGPATATWRRIADDYAAAPIKPVLDGEPLYEDHPLAFDAPNLGYSHAHDVRSYLYLDLFAGAFGHTYGHHTVWQFHEAKHGAGVNRPVADWRQALEAPGAGAIGHARHLLESRPFLSRVPAPEIVVPDPVESVVPGAGLRRVGATRDAKGSYAFVYGSVARPCVVRVRDLAGTTLQAWFFDPRTGTHADLGRHRGGGLVEFTPPWVGEPADWVLVVDDADAGFPPPGQGEARPPGDGCRLAGVNG